MTVIDTILILIFVLAAVIGFRKGFIRQVGSLAAIVVGVVAARVLGPDAICLIHGGETDWAVSPVPRFSVTMLSYISVFAVSYVAVRLLASLLSRITGATFIGPVDSIAGAVVSIAKYFLLLSLLLNLYIAVFPSTQLISRLNVGGLRPVELVVDFAPWIFDTISPAMAGSSQQPEPVKI